MQTFLPYANFNLSAEVLDLRRLGKQIIECGQILRAMILPPEKYKGWRNHPATNMWRGFEPALYGYAMAMSEEWEERRDKTHGATARIENEFGLYGKIQVVYSARYDLPDWLGGEIHKTHQSNLVRKDREYYQKFFPDVPDDLEYFWPV